MILEWWQALLLGALQGATEFLPISSSGHLVLVPYLVGWTGPGLAFDAAVHGGTLGALVAAFRTELAAMARSLAGARDPDARLARRLALLVLAGTAPLVAVWLAAAGLVERSFTSEPVAATGLLATGAVLYGGERWRARRRADPQAASVNPTAGEAATWPGDWIGGEPQEPPEGADRAGEGDGGAEDRAGEGDGGAEDRAAAAAGAMEVGADDDDPRGATLDELTLGGAVLVGLGQAVAVLPGVSRSGTTIIAGVVTGLTREAAARFAFLLGLPALGGATVLSAADFAAEGAGALGWPALAGAVAVAFVAGLAAIRWLLRLVARASLNGFAVYCAAAGVAGWLAVLMLGAGAGDV